MLKRTGQLVGVTLAVAAGALLIAWFVPLSTTEHTAVALKHATDTFLLQQGQPLQQKFVAAGGWQSGIVIYSTAPFLDHQPLSVRILDEQGRQRAHGTTATTSYIENDDTVRIALATTWLKAKPQERLQVELQLTHGSPLPLKIITEIPGRQDIALGVLQPSTLSAGARQGVLAGVVVMLGVLLIALWVPPRWQWYAAASLLVIATLTGVTGFWFSPDRLGIADWDYYFSLHTIYRQTILHYHQLPFWNPYTCGGTAGIGDPEFPLFTPTFLLELIFGIPTGLRLAIYFSIVTGGIGMLTLAKRLRLSVWAGLLAALVYMFSTVNLLEIVEGHVNIFAAMWLPWLWWSWLGAYYKPTRWRILLVGLFFALLFMQAGIYLLVYTLFALLLVILLSQKKLRALSLTALSGFWALGIVAIKLLPVLLWLRQFPQQTFATSAFSLPWLSDILFGRYLHGAYLIFRQRSGWHEYGAYIGYIVFGLSLLGLTQLRKRRTIVLLVIIGLTALILAVSGPALDPIFNVLWFIPRSNISRIIILTIISVALLAGFGLDTLRQRVRHPLVPIVLIGFVALDLMSLAYPASLQAFVLPPVYPAPKPPPPPLAYTSQTFDYQARDIHQTRTYEATKQGWGNLFHCSVLGPKPAIIPVESENDPRLFTATSHNATSKLTSWTPNHITAEVAAPAPTTIVLNANYVAGWEVNGQTPQIVSNRVAAAVPAGRTTLNFTYQPPGFRLGLAITTLTLLITALLFLV